MNPENRPRKSSPPIDEQHLVFTHLRECLSLEQPERIIERYRKLFIYGTAYPTPRVLASLERLAARSQNSPEREQFGAFVGRCWYLAINQWLETPDRQGAIPGLTELFDDMPPPTKSRSVNRLREAVRAFSSGSQCLRLRRLGRLIARYQVESGSPADNKSKNAGTVGSSLVRYPFLYEHCYLREDDIKTYRRRILQAKETNQKRFEEQLSRYAVELIRERYGTGRLKGLNDPLALERTLKVVRNPTMLSEENLLEAIKVFLGLEEGCPDYRDTAKSFRLRAAQCRTYRFFKGILSEYVTAAAKKKYVEQRLGNNLRQFFDKLQPHRDDEAPDEALQQRTYCQLLNFLVVESSQSPGALLFLDEISQQGALKTIAMLLRIVLLCPEKVAPHLGKRFAVLFDCYDAASREDVPWLIKSLELWQLAQTIYIHDADLSIWKQLV